MSSWITNDRMYILTYGLFWNGLMQELFRRRGGRIGAVSLFVDMIDVTAFQYIFNKTEKRDRRTDMVKWIQDLNRIINMYKSLTNI